MRIFPEALRGAGEGQFPWDLKPDTVMTNATAGTITKTPAGNVVQVSYKGKTYFVCCTGCRDLFKDHPERILAEAAEREKAAAKK